jgi:hypothetical protein
MIALVWNGPVRLVDITVRYELYVEGLRELGIEPVTVCPAGSEAGYPYPTRTFDSEREITDPRFWQSLGCRAAVIITWHRMTDVMTAARAAGLKVLAVGESDGQVSLRFHSWPTLRYRTYVQPTIYKKFAAAKLWAQRVLLHGVAEDRGLVENTAAADVYTLAGDGPVAVFHRLLCRLGAANLTERVVCLPYPVPTGCCTGHVVADRPDRVIAVGRWDSPQKNAPLLEKAIRRLSTRRRTEVLIVGRGGERFARLARDIPTVRVLGLKSRDQVRDLMANCRTALFSSRWEGCPVSANEMLALGGTVVGTPIPSLSGITADGRFGRVCWSHTAAALAATVTEEMVAWDTHRRDPAAIAAHWRPLVSPAAVAARMLTLLGLSDLGCGTNH